MEQIDFVRLKISLAETTRNPGSRKKGRLIGFVGLWQPHGGGNGVWKSGRLSLSGVRSLLLEGPSFTGSLGYPAGMGEVKDRS